MSIGDIMKSSKKVTPPKARAEKTGTPVFTRLQDELLERLDEWRRLQADLPNRAEAIRRLLDQALGGRRAKK